MHEELGGAIKACMKSFSTRVARTLILLAGIIYCIGNAVPVARGAIVGQLLGTNAPPPTLGAYTMTQFPADPTGNGMGESSLSSPLGGVIGFNTPYGVYHTVVGWPGFGWQTWSHGYTGDVYTTSDLNSADKTSRTLYLPPNTGAFFLYAEQNVGFNDPLTVEASDGTLLTQFVAGDGGASGFGFYSTAGESIASVTIRTTDQSGFAFGELGIAIVPEPTSLSLLLIGLGALSIRRFR